MLRGFSEWVAKVLGPHLQDEIPFLLFPSIEGNTLSIFSQSKQAIPKICFPDLLLEIQSYQTLQEQQCMV